MKISSIFLSCIFASGLTLKAQVDNSNNGPAEADAIVPSDLFIDMLNAAKDQPSDPMGTQRLIQVKDSSITPVMTASTAFKYTSNPDKIKRTYRRLPIFIFPPCLSKVVRELIKLELYCTFWIKFTLPYCLAPKFG